MRNLNWKSLLVIVIVVGLALSSLIVKQIDIQGFERGSDKILGLQLGLDLAGGVHLVYRPADKENPPSAEQMELIWNTGVEHDTLE